MLFGINLDTQANMPLYRQLHSALRDAILNGRLMPGERLPSSRTLARSLGCSRNTVIEAYDLLIAEGYLEGRIGAGSFVSQAFAENWVHERPIPADTDAKPSAPRLSRAGRTLLEMAARNRGGNAARADPTGPDPAAFPFDLWARALARAWRRPDAHQAFRGSPMGYPPLRDAIADYLRNVRALDCTGARIMITSGAQHALDLAVRLLLDPGDEAWIEEPAYRGVRAAIAAVGAKAVPVPVDVEGFDVANAMLLAPDARLALVTPSHQFPLGVTMSFERRMRLLDWAAAGDRWIVEDDYDSEFLYAGRPIPALQGLDRSQRVIYVGTFSKAIFPGLRLGYMVLPDSLIDGFRAARLLLDGHTSTVGQLALAEFMADGRFTAHLRKMRTLYGRRREIMLEHIHRKLTPFLDGAPGEAGMHLLAFLRPDIDDAEIARRAASAGISCQPLSSFHSGATPRPGLLLGFGCTPNDTIPNIVDRLAMLLDQADFGSR
jgi:GntR family transcriptional regulator/MocR family aminotransferase